MPKFRSGEDHPNWNGGRTTKGRYVMVRAKDHPRANRHGYVLEHILVAEKALGRRLHYYFVKCAHNEEVHHINLDPADNRPENLLVCYRWYHTLLHTAIEERGLLSHFRSLRPCA